MKPLPVPPYTARDLQVWGLVCERFRPRSGCYWYEAGQAADRRDAALMLQAQRRPTCHAMVWVTLQGSQRIEVRGRVELTRDWSPLFDIT
jgi:hypothetical protein